MQYLLIKKNTKTFDPHRLLLKLTYKISLKIVMNMLLYQIFAYTTHICIYYTI